MVIHHRDSPKSSLCIHKSGIRVHESPNLYELGTCFVLQLKLITRYYLVLYSYLMLDNQDYMFMVIGRVSLWWTLQMRYTEHAKYRQLLCSSVECCIFRRG